MSLPAVVSRTPAPSGAMANDAIHGLHAGLPADEKAPAQEGTASLVPLGTSANAQAKALNVQAAYDLRVAEIDNAKRIEREIVPATA